MSRKKGSVMCKKRGGREGGRRGEREEDHAGSRAARGEVSERGAGGRRGVRLREEGGPVDAGTPGERGISRGEGARREG